MSLHSYIKNMKLMLNYKLIPPGTLSTDCCKLHIIAKATPLTALVYCVLAGFFGFFISFFRGDLPLAIISPFY